MVLVISCSLSRTSRSRELARIAHRRLETCGSPSAFVDLQEHDLPLCDAGAAYAHPSVVQLSAAISRAAGLIIAAPIYNYDLNSATKNLLELTGKAWAGKVVGFLCAAGGESSYMSVMPFANSLMLDYRCVIVPRFVYATGKDFTNGILHSEEIRGRVDELATGVARFSEALAPLILDKPQ